MSDKEGVRVNPDEGEGAKFGRKQFDAVSKSKTWIGALAMAVTAIVTVWWAHKRPHSGSLFYAEIALLVMWVLVPPIWFNIDWYYWDVNPNSKLPRKEQFDDFKHSQDLARNLWVAIAGLLTVLLFKP
jgi:hypothetical protein